jgi:hypothetical protein
VAGPAVRASSIVRRLSSASARRTASTARMYQVGYVTVKVHKQSLESARRAGAARGITMPFT